MTNNFKNNEGHNINGPWTNEPDETEWESYGYKCVIKRNNRMGTWNGYVAFGYENPFFGIKYGESHPNLESLGDSKLAWEGPEDFDFGVAIRALLGQFERTPGYFLNVHGGITWSEDHPPWGEPDGRWWYGFDCGHLHDFSPGMKIMERYDERMKKIFKDRHEKEEIDFEKGTCQGPFGNEVYRDHAYAMYQCERLAEQLAKYEATTPEGIRRILGDRRPNREDSAGGV